jgi:lysophospholipase L1-like esterase
VPRRLDGQTVRQVARVSIGGARIRVEVSNAFGDRPLVIGAAGVGLAGPDGTIVAGSHRAVTFGGLPSVVVPPGAPAWSDPVELAVPDLGLVAVSLYFPEPTSVGTIHRDGRRTAWISGRGDFTGASAFAPVATTQARLFLSGLAVPADGARAVVVLGDSIADGDGSTPDTDRRWPDRLAERLVAAGARVAVLNEGVSGALLLRDRLGPNALARFDRDVLGHPRTETLIVAIGINDVGWPAAEGGGRDLVAGYRQLVARARAHGIKVVGATLTPFAGGPGGAREAARAEVNAWIREGGAFDAVIDFDAVLRDPADPARMRPEFDSGDGLHPGDAGYAAMAEAVDLGLFGVRRAARPAPRRRRSRREAARCRLCVRRPDGSRRRRAAPGR